MTVFTQIGQNNWPSTDNQYDDFLALRLPLNNQKSLTESSVVAAGKKILVPSKALTNSGVLAVAAGGSVYTDNLASISINTSVRNNTPKSNIFDGSTTTKYEWNVSGTSPGNSGTCTITFNPPLTNVTTLQVHAWLNNNQYDKHGVSVNGGPVIYPDIYGGDNQWWNLLSGTFSGSGFTGGTLSSLAFRTEVNMSGQNPSGWVRAIEVNGTILKDGSPRKNYDYNAAFSNSVLTTTERVPRGNLPRTVEFWAYMKSGCTSWENMVSYGNSAIGGCFGINRGNSDSSNIAFTGYGSGDWDTGVSVSSYLNTWTHFSVGYDGANVSMFINGSQIGTVARSLNTGGSTFVIGGSEHSGNNERFNGLLQDVRVYNTRIRTSNFTPPGPTLGSA